MDKKSTELIRQGQELCNRIDEDYNIIINSNSSTKTLLKEVEELIHSYGKEQTKLRAFYNRNQTIIRKDCDFDELMRLVNSYKRAFSLLEIQLKKIEKS